MFLNGRYFDTLVLCSLVQAQPTFAIPVRIRRCLTGVFSQIEPLLDDTSIGEITKNMRRIAFTHRHVSFLQNFGER
jgi:hypothetical protein